MVRETEPSTSESTFVHSALKKGLRLDGREPYELRQILLNFSTELGWVECCLGQTRVLAMITAEIVAPQADRPYEGFLSLTTEISPMASSSFEAGRNSEEETTTARLLEKAIRKSNCVDREALCIVAGSKVWSIKVNLHFLNDAGNLLDCASIAAITALRHFRKPDVTVIGEDITIHSISERVPIPLAIHHTPLCLTFAFFGETAIPVLDPSTLESLLQNGTLTLTLNSQQEICVLTKAGGIPLEVEMIMGIVLRGVGIVKEVDAIVRKALEKDAKSRILEVR